MSESQTEKCNCGKPVSDYHDAFVRALCRDCYATLVSPCQTCVGMLAGRCVDCNHVVNPGQEVVTEHVKRLNAVSSAIPVLVRRPSDQEIHAYLRAYPDWFREWVRREQRVQGGPRL